MRENRLRFYRSRKMFLVMFVTFTLFGPIFYFMWKDESLRDVDITMLS